LPEIKRLLEPKGRLCQNRSCSHRLQLAKVRGARHRFRRRDTDDRPTVRKVSDEAVKRVEELRALLRHHNERYFALDSPEISDGDFDVLVRELAALEVDYLDLAATDSPTKTVGAGATFAPVQHDVPSVPMNSTSGTLGFRALLARTQSSAHLCVS
jgi:hypothetical protein